LTAPDRVALLRFARTTLEAQLAGRPLPSVPDVPGAALRRGAFVTILERGALRGCIGQVENTAPLGVVVREMTVAAARDDPRFAPVAREELGGLTLEISVLTRAAPLPGTRIEPGAIAPGRDGLIVRRGRHVGLLLPQVATEYRWGPEAFLAATCRKAGLPPQAWREPDTEVLTFQADVFGE
jgi:AmmeMemoRadiSam system protein A